MTDSSSQPHDTPRRERLVYVSVDQLSPGPHAPSTATVPEGMAASIRTYGVLHPLLVRPGAEGYEVIAGFKRLRAAREAGLSEVPVRVYRAEDESLEAMYAASNVSGAGTAARKRVAPPSGSGESIAGGTLGGFIEEELGRKSSPVPYGRILGVAAVILIVGWIALVATRSWRERRPRDSRPADASAVDSSVTPPAVPGERGDANRGSRTVADWRAALSDIDGMEVRDIGGIPRLVFRDPVFSRLTTVDPAQKPRLERLVTRILEIEPRAVLMVIGHTDNDPIRPSSEYRSNEYLSELRARAVIDYLREVEAAPAAKLKPVAVGAQDPPFSNQNPADKARNRTVTLEIMQPVR